MATIKAYTTVEQSRKLAEILPLESADMYWKNGVSNKYIQCLTPFVIDDYRANVEFDYDVPCWSLTALLGVLPNIIKGEHFKTLSFLYEWHCAYMNGNGEILNCDTSADNPIDACVAMIEKLHELKLL